MMMRNETCEDLGEGNSRQKEQTMSGVESMMSFAVLGAVGRAEGLEQSDKRVGLLELRQRQKSDQGSVPQETRLDFTVW